MKGSRPNLQPSPSRPTIYTYQLCSGSSPPLSSLQHWRWAFARIWGGGGGGGEGGWRGEPTVVFILWDTPTTTAPKTTPPPPCLLSCFYPYSRIFSTSSGFPALLLVAVAACARLCVCVSGGFLLTGREERVGVGRDDGERSSRRRRGEGGGGEIMGWPLPLHVLIKITRECKTDFLNASCLFSSVFFSHPVLLCWGSPGWW